MRHEKVFQIGMTTALVLIFLQLLPAWAGGPPAQYYLPDKYGGYGPVVNCNNTGPLDRYKRLMEGRIKSFSEMLEKSRAAMADAEPQYRQAAKDFDQAVREKDIAKQNEAKSRYDEQYGKYWNARYYHNLYVDALRRLQDELKGTLDHYNSNCNIPCVYDDPRGAGVCR